MSLVLLYSTIAGVIGTGIGGLIGIFIGKKSSKLISAILSIAGGIMLAVVFFDLLPEAQALYNNNFVILLGLVWGILILFALNKIVDIANKKVLLKVQTLGIYNVELQYNISKTDANKLKKSGWFLMLAIALHNIPEGIAIGTIGTIENSLVMTMAIVICVHNIPEGMAISLPLSAGNMGKIKSLFLATTAGGMTIVGGFVGVLLGQISTVVTSFFLAFAGGAMLQVTLCEIMPDALDLDLSKKPFIYTLLGVLLGFVINFFV